MTVYELDFDTIVVTAGKITLQLTRHEAQELYRNLDRILTDNGEEEVNGFPYTTGYHDDE